MEPSEKIAQVRRRDRVKDDIWIRTFLRQAPFGFLAMEAGGRPFLNSNLFVYDRLSHSIYLHTARTGRTPESIAEGIGGPVAFSAAVMGRLLPAPEALEFSVEYSAVVAFGNVKTVTSATEKRHGLELLMEKYAPHLVPGPDFRPITEDELRRTAVHRIGIESWSGKEKSADPEFPGAYLIPVPQPPVVAAARGQGEIT